MSLSARAPGSDGKVVRFATIFLVILISSFFLGTVSQTTSSERVETDGKHRTRGSSTTSDTPPVSSRPLIRPPDVSEDDDWVHLDSALVKGPYPDPECIRWVQSMGFFGGGPQSHVDAADGRVISSSLVDGVVSVLVYTYDAVVQIWTEEVIPNPFLSGYEEITHHHHHRHNVLWYKWADSIAANGDRLAISSRVVLCKPQEEALTCHLDSRIWMYEWDTTTLQYHLISLTSDLNQGQTMVPDFIATNHNGSIMSNLSSSSSSSSPSWTAEEGLASGAWIQHIGWQGRAELQVAECGSAGRAGRAGRASLLSIHGGQVWLQEWPAKEGNDRQCPKKKKKKTSAPRERSHDGSFVVLTGSDVTHVARRVAMDGDVIVVVMELADKHVLPEGCPVVKEHAWGGYAQETPRETLARRTREQNGIECTSYVQIFVQTREENEQGAWVPVQRLRPFTAYYSSSLRVDVKDGVIAVGEPEGDAGAFLDSGRVVVWAWKEEKARWVAQGHVISPWAKKGMGSMDNFGQDVALQRMDEKNGQKRFTLAVGSSDLNGEGIVCVYDANDRGEWVHILNFESSSTAHLVTEDVKLSEDMMLVRCDWPVRRLFVFDAQRELCYPEGQAWLASKNLPSKGGIRPRD